MIRTVESDKEERHDLFSRLLNASQAETADAMPPITERELVGTPHSLLCFISCKLTIVSSGNIFIFLLAVSYCPHPDSLTCTFYADILHRAMRLVTCSPFSYVTMKLQHCLPTWTYRRQPIHSVSRSPCWLYIPRSKRNCTRRLRALCLIQRDFPYVFITVVSHVLYQL